MKKTNRKIALGMTMLFLLSLVLSVGPMPMQTAKADAPTPVTTRLIGGTSSLASDGQIVSVAGFNTAAYFMDAMGTVYSYGSGSWGQLGNGSYSASAVTLPVKKMMDNTNLSGIDRIWGSHNYAVFAYDYDTDELFAWGYNAGLRVWPDIPTNGGVSSAVSVQLPQGVKVSKEPNAIAVGAQHVTLLDQNGEVWSWGQMEDYNNPGQNRLGYCFDNQTLRNEHANEYEFSGNFVYITVPHKVPLPLLAGEKVTGVYVGWIGLNYAFTDEGRVFAWGANNSNSNPIYISMMVLSNPNGTDENFTFTKIAVGKSSNVVLLGNDGKVYKNLPGGSRPSIVSELSVDDTFVDIGSAADNGGKVAGMAVRADDTVWVWGNQSTGRLGDGIMAEPSYRDEAVLIETLPDFPADAENYTGGSLSWYFNQGLMLKNGIVYAWGHNPNTSMYPMTPCPETKTSQSLWPRRIFYGYFPEQLRFDGNSYPETAPYADATYSFSKTDVTGGYMDITVRDLHAGFEGKEVIFYNEENAEYGRGTVSGGQATVRVGNLCQTQTIEVRVTCEDEKYQIWAPALGAGHLTYELNDVLPTPSPVPTPSPTPKPSPTPVSNPADYDYQENETDVTITGYNRKNQYILLPNTYNGKPVTAIGDGAFQFNSNLKTVIIPESITEIGSWAFMWCESLSSITIPQSMTNVGMDAFEGTPWFENHTDEFVVVGNGILIAYQGADTEVTVPDGVISIGGGVFKWNDTLTQVTLPETLTRIGDYAFVGCTALQSVVIPSGVEEIGEAAFAACSSLQTIDVAPENAFYTSEDGILYDKGKTTLLTCAGGKTGTVEVPAGVQSIAFGAFAGSKIEEIVLPNGLLDIGESAFTQCRNLQSVVLPDSLTRIGNYAFAWCSNLSKAYFYGDQSALGKGVFEGCAEGFVLYTYPPAELTVTWEVQGDYISGITPGCTVDDVLAGISLSHATVMVKSSGTELQGGDSVGTGTTFEIYDEQNNLVATYTLIIYGDLNGDGNITAMDLLALKQYFLKSTTFAQVTLTASDVCKDESVGVLDLLALKKHLLGLQLIVQ